MAHYLDNLTRFCLKETNFEYQAWYLIFRGITIGVLTNHHEKGPRALVTRVGGKKVHKSVVYGLTVKECLIIAENAYLDMADWDRPLDPVDEEAEIDRERHAD